jgi:hypothetical protein
LFLLLTALVACNDDSVADVASCDVVLTSLEPAADRVGSDITLTGSPFTAHYDSALFVGGIRAEVSAVDRTSCDACDQCRVDEACNECEDCDACDVACRVDCVETLSFKVPDAPSGEQILLLYNAHGSSNTLLFTVLETPDTGETLPSDSGEDSGTDSGGPADSATQGTGTTE